MASFATIFKSLKLKILKNFLLSFRCNDLQMLCKQNIYSVLFFSASFCLSAFHNLLPVLHLLLSQSSILHYFCSFLSLTLYSLPVPFSVTPHLTNLPKCTKNNLVKLHAPSLFHLCVENFRNEL